MIHQVIQICSSMLEQITSIHTEEVGEGGRITGHIAQLKKIDEV